MTNMKTKVARCEGGGQQGLNGAPPGETDRCPVCTARPRVKPNGTLKAHEKKSPRTM